MNKPFYILFFVFCNAFSFAQINIVPNPSFEIIDSCYGDPSSIGFDVFQWSGCVNWSCPTNGSSDLWCENPVFGAQTPPSIPGVGYQQPRTGQNMAGLLIYDISYPNYREYIQNKFSQTLEEGKFYEFSFYVNTADNIYNATSSIDIYFSSTLTSQSNWQPLLFNPQIKNDRTFFITDTLGWQLVSGIYQARGDEQYATIGCFNDSSSIIVKDTNWMTGSSIYLFVDDFELKELPISITIPNIFSPNADAENDLFSPSIINIENWELKIFNRWGEFLTQINPINQYWDGLKYSAGVYFYTFEAEIKQKKIKQKGFIQLVR